MSRFVPVARVGDVQPGEARAFVVGDREVALFNVGGTYYAIENSCPHQGAPLADGFIDGNVVTCPWHAWCFDIRTGDMTIGALTSVDAFDVRVVDGSTIEICRDPRASG